MRKLSKTSNKMTKLTTTQARRKFGDVINEVAFAKNRVALVRRGKRLAYVIPPEDYDLLEALEDRLDGERALKILRNPKTKWKSWDKVRARLDRLP